MTARTCPDWPRLMEIAPDLQFKHHDVSEARLPAEALAKLEGVLVSELEICADLDHYVYNAEHTDPTVAEALRSRTSSASSGRQGSSAASAGQRGVTGSPARPRRSRSPRSSAPWKAQSRTCVVRGRKTSRTPARPTGSRRSGLPSARTYGRCSSTSRSPSSRGGSYRLQSSASPTTPTPGRRARRPSRERSG